MAGWFTSLLLLFCPLLESELAGVWLVDLFFLFLLFLSLFGVGDLTPFVGQLGFTGVSLGFNPLFLLHFDRDLLIVFSFSLFILDWPDLPRIVKWL